MKNIRTVTILWTAALLGSIGGTPACAQTGFFADLTVTATPEKATVIWGEPIVLNVQVANPTSQPITAHKVLDPAYERIWVEIQGPGDTAFRRYLGPRWGVAERRPKPVDIASGETVYGTATILFNQAIQGDEGILATDLPFVPGVYRLRARFLDAGFAKAVVSTVAQVEIFQPSQNERPASESLRSDAEYAYFLQTGDTRKGDAAVEMAKQIVERYPDAIYTKYMALALGKFHRHSGDAAQAMRYLTIAAGHDKGSYVRGQALNEMAGVYAEQRDFAKVRELSQAAAIEFVRTSVGPEFSAWLRRFPAPVRQ